MFGVTHPTAEDVLLESIAIADFISCISSEQSHAKPLQETEELVRSETAESSCVSGAAVGYGRAQAQTRDRPPPGQKRP